MKVADLSQESVKTRQLYGLEDQVSAPFGQNCLLARRLIESGVRFVTLISGTGGGAGWDTHNNIQGALPGLCRSIDRPIYGLITDMKARGLLKDTLIVWSGEFGVCPPFNQLAHDPDVITILMVSACGWREQVSKPEMDYGDTDDLGYAANKEEKVTHSDVHATIQHLVGLDYRKNTFSYEGRDESLVGVNPARVIKEILA